MKYLSYEKLRYTLDSGHFLNCIRSPSTLALLVEFKIPEHFGKVEYDEKRGLNSEVEILKHIRVPPIEDLAAVKLGLPADYKNIFDSLILLQMCHIDDVVASIQRNNHWSELVLRRLPKYIGRLHNQKSLVYRIAMDARIDIKKSESRLSAIQRILETMQ